MEHVTPPHGRPREGGGTGGVVALLPRRPQGIRGLGKTTPRDCPTFPFQPDARATFALESATLAKEHDAAAAAFGGVHGLIGAAGQLVGALAMVRKDGNADAGGDRVPVAIDVEGFVDEVQSPVGDPSCRVSVTGREDESELVAPESGDEIALSQVGPQPFAQLDEQPVAVMMTERVVDLLEAIEIQHEHRDRCSLVPGVVEPTAEAVREQAPIGETGEPVVQRLMAKRRCRERPLGDVLDRQPDCPPTDREHVHEQHPPRPRLRSSDLTTPYGPRQHHIDATITQVGIAPGVEQVAKIRTDRVRAEQSPCRRVHVDEHEAQGAVVYLVASDPHPDRRHLHQKLGASVIVLQSDVGPLARTSAFLGQPAHPACSDSAWLVSAHSTSNVRLFRGAGDTPSRHREHHRVE
jgi:hypothetical protein